MRPVLVPNQLNTLKKERKKERKKEEERKKRKLKLYTNLFDEKGCKNFQ